MAMSFTNFVLIIVAMVIGVTAGTFLVEWLSSLKPVSCWMYDHAKKRTRYIDEYVEELEKMEEAEETEETEDE